MEERTGESKSKEDSVQTLKGRQDSGRMLERLAVKICVSHIKRRQETNKNFNLSHTRARSRSNTITIDAVPYYYRSNVIAYATDKTM